MSKWSASRVGCYVSCPLKYKYQYIDKWVSSEPVNNELAYKGLSFHETVEQYTSQMSDEDLKKILAVNVEKYKVDIEKYPVDKAIDKFLCFWKRFIKPRENEGYSILKESWVNGTVKDEAFCGALDLYVSNDKKVEIYDYKTAKTANASRYKNQLILYAFLEGQSRKWTNKQIAENTVLRVFFPLTEIKDGETIEESMLKSVKEIKFTEKDVDDVMNDYYKHNIDVIHATDWEKVTNANGVLSHDCSYCPYCGSSDNGQGFGGCMKTKAAGFATPDGVTFQKKTEEKAKV